MTAYCQRKVPLFVFVNLSAALDDGIDFLERMADRIHPWQRRIIDAKAHLNRTERHLAGHQGVLQLMGQHGRESFLLL